MRRDRGASTAVLLLLSCAAAQGQDALNRTESQPLNPLSAIPASDLKAFAERPLFTPSRRPATSDQPLTRAVELEEKPEHTSDLLLLGVISGPDGAVARIESGSSRYSVQRGDDIGGWVLKDMDASSVTIERHNEIKTLRIFDKEKAGPPILTDEDAEEKGAGVGIVFETSKPSEEGPKTPSVLVHQD